jgi:hypothetical protein
MYRQVFMSGLGTEVLTDLLTRLHVFDEVDTTPKWRRWFRDKNEEVVLANFGKRILGIMGVWQGANALDITQALLRIPVRDDGAEEKR